MRAVQLHGADISVRPVTADEAHDLQFHIARCHGFKLKLVKRCAHIFVVWNLELADFVEWPALVIRCKERELLQVMGPLGVDVNGERGDGRRLFLA